VNKAGLPRLKMRGFVLVRDKDGKIKADGDPNRWPDEVKAGLTDEERQYLGVMDDGDT
jgi:hypothetical protein